MIPHPYNHPSISKGDSAILIYIELAINESRNSQNTLLENIKDYPKNISRKKVTVRLLMTIILYIYEVKKTTLDI